MIAPLVAFLVSAVLAVVSTPAVRRWAQGRGAADRGEGDRAMHEQPIPRFGGLAVAGAFFAPIVLLWAVDPRTMSAFARAPGVGLAFVVGGLAALALGARDDLAPLGPLSKFAGQLVIAAGVAALGLRMEMVSVPGMGLIELGGWAIPITVLWLVVVMNAVNLIDGLDGLASGLSLGIVALLFVVSVLNGQMLGVLVGASLAGALLGFLRHNSHPATIFLGDSGSLFVGFVLGAWSLLAWQKSATGVALLVLVVGFALPLGDTVFAVLRRLAAGRKPWEADAGHIHHRLVGGGLSHRGAVYSLYAVGVALTLLAFVLLGVRQ